ncbi:calcified cuticle protein CP19.0 isoform A [Penaeus vannamei]|uniref:Calcified cuticle protein CP19.0 isoform A n=1 Tax=Penaeus vannamei TaxID=6689 RepID=A0A423TWJ1_PENVA|nr:calcified cuticle protein CP19.0 isoform A [Penaeus vannamei]
MDQVLLAVLGVCSAVPFIQDTPEVQAEKARFFQSFLVWTRGCPVPAGVDTTITPVGDTHEVAAARTAFLNAYNAQVRATAGAAPAVPSFAPAYSPAPAVRAAPVQPKWTGPVAATVPAGLPGSAPQVADTPEVAAAKQEFFNTFQRQAAAAAPPSRNYF